MSVKFGVECFLMYLVEPGFLGLECSVNGCVAHLIRQTSVNFLLAVWTLPHPTVGWEKRSDADDVDDADYDDHDTDDETKELTGDGN